MSISILNVFCQNLRKYSKFNRERNYRSQCSMNEVLSSSLIIQSSSYELFYNYRNSMKTIHPYFETITIQFLFSVNCSPKEFLPLLWENMIHRVYYYKYVHMSTSNGLREVKVESIAIAMLLPCK